MFQKIRRIAKSPVNVVFMSALILFVSCKDSYTPTRQDVFSGQDLFNGIIFGMGPASKHLPSVGVITKVEDILDAKDPLYKEFIAIKDLMLKTMEEDNPNFFNEFKKGIESGDRMLIQETLNLSAAKYREAMNKVSGLNDDQLNSKTSELVVKYQLVGKDGKYSKENLKNAIRSLSTDPKDYSGRDACLWVAIAAVVIVVLVIAQVAVAYFQWTYAAQETSVIAEQMERTGSTGSLFRDQLINEIAVNLKR